MNEQVLCDGEWSCDLCVVWLESQAATELTPHMWTQQCGCSLSLVKGEQGTISVFVYTDQEISSKRVDSAGETLQPACVSVKPENVDILYLVSGQEL